MSLYDLARCKRCKHPRHRHVFNSYAKPALHCKVWADNDKQRCECEQYVDWVERNE